jgi:hypothetical protein
LLSAVRVAAAMGVAVPVAVAVAFVPDVPAGIRSQAASMRANASEHSNDMVITAMGDLCIMRLLLFKPLQHPLQLLRQWADELAPFAR